MQEKHGMQNFFTTFSIINCMLWKVCSFLNNLLLCGFTSRLAAKQIMARFHLNCRTHLVQLLQQWHFVDNNLKECALAVYTYWGREFCILIVWDAMGLTNVIWSVAVFGRNFFQTRIVLNSEWYSLNIIHNSHPWLELHVKPIMTNHWGVTVFSKSLTIELCSIYIEAVNVSKHNNNIKFMRAMVLIMLQQTHYTNIHWTK